jgi:putative hydrolase of the HAD superfamily
MSLSNSRGGTAPSGPVRAVLFDLDDTLFDHRRSSTEALRHVHTAYDGVRRVPFDEFEQEHSRVLEEMHLSVVGGQLGMDEARCERFRRLFEAFGARIDVDGCAAAAGVYRREYLAARRATEGAAALVQAVRAHAAVGIVSSNMLQEQKEKLEFCRLAAHVDVLIVSEEVGLSKPDPGIFQMALDRLNVHAEDAVMVGDSWTADVAGARACGMRAFWFNPLRLPCPDPELGVAELHAWVPTADVARLLLASS